MGIVCLLINIHLCASLELVYYIQDRNFFKYLIIFKYRFIAKNYPSEILEGRLYLGDQFHA